MTGAAKQQWHQMARAVLLNNNCASELASAAKARITGSGKGSNSQACAAAVRAAVATTATARPAAMDDWFPHLIPCLGDVPAHRVWPVMQTAKFTTGPPVCVS